MIPKKPAPDVIGGGNRFSDKIMRKELHSIRRCVHDRRNKIHEGG
jgi:hypothetical protein